MGIRTLSIFHVDGHGKLTSWPVLTGADNVYQAESGLAVTSAGMVWLGINVTLTRLDPSTGAVQTWRIPAPGDNPAAESFRPTDTQGQYLVQAIAASPDGRQIAPSRNPPRASEPPASASDRPEYGQGDERRPARGSATSHQARTRRCSSAQVPDHRPDASRQPDIGASRD